MSKNPTVKSRKISYLFRLLEAFGYAAYELVTLKNISDSNCSWREFLSRERRAFPFTPARRRAWKFEEQQRSRFLFSNVVRVSDFDESVAFVGVSTSLNDVLTGFQLTE